MGEWGNGGEGIQLSWQIVFSFLTRTEAGDIAAVNGHGFRVARYKKIPPMPRGMGGMKGGGGRTQR